MNLKSDIKSAYSKVHIQLWYAWPTRFTQPVILHFCAENSRLKLKDIARVSKLQNE